jgi:adenosylcobyric acid synthase
MKAVSILGTASSVGKSWMTTALCAWLRQQGVRVAPCKVQNMSNNAWATLEGGEMARAQAVQAEACGLRPRVEMNPILLKPAGGTAAQLVVCGKAEGHLTGVDYYRHTAGLWQRVTEVLDGWRAHCDVLVLEGAGSPVELNLMDRDLVNLRPLRHLDGRWLLVGDIDRGGVFAQLAGTWQLLPVPDRARGLGAIVNRFRGDLRLFEHADRWLSGHAPGLSLLGTVPFRTDLQPEEEDGLTSADEDRGSGDLLAWIRFPHAANLTDCQPWWDDAGVRVRWVASPNELARARVIVLPGSKNTIADLRWLRSSGLADAVVAAAERGVLVIGLCGGFQMLGLEVADPQGVAGDAGDEPGLALLPITTLFQADKLVRQVEARCDGRRWVAYEIHMGRTELSRPCDSLHSVWAEGREHPEGVRLGNVWGTYLHGWFEAPEVRSRVARAAALSAHCAPLWSWAEKRQAVYSQMAEHVAVHVDLSPVRDSSLPVVPGDGMTGGPVHRERGGGWARETRGGG